MKMIYGVLFAIIYTVGYVFLAALSTGGGHGNFILFFPVLTWVFNFVALYLLTKLESPMIRIFFVVMMSVYYIFTFSLLWSAYTDKEMRTYPQALLIPAVWYVLGQLVIWVAFAGKVINLKHTNKF